MKLGLYWSYATRSLIRGGQRTLLAIFCVAVGALAVVSLQTVGAEATASFTSNQRTANGGDLHVRPDNGTLTAGDLATFASLKQQGTITTYTAAQNHGAQSVGTAKAVSGVRTQFYNLFVVDPAVFPLGGGAVFTDPKDGSVSSLVRGDNVVIMKSLADTLGVGVGDTVTVTSDDGRAPVVTVAGIIDNTLPFVSFNDGTTGLMLMDATSYAAVPSASVLPITYTDVFADVPNHSDANAAAAAKTIQDAFKTTASITVTATTAKQQIQQNQSNAQGLRYFLQVTSLLALLIGGVGVSNTIAVLLRRRRTEIAMLKTAGYKRRDLYLLFGLETGLLGLIGGVLGAAAGVSVSFAVQGIFEHAFAQTLPTLLDPLTIASGVAIGLFTALVFGLLPIVRASAIRPLAILRELPDGQFRFGTLTTSALLGALLIAFFVALSLGILGDLGVTLTVTLGAAVALLALAAIFFLVVFVVSKLRVPDGYRWWSVLLSALLLLAGIGLSLAGDLSTSANVLRLLLLALGVFGLALPLVPRLWRENLRIALRNLGRQRARSVTTLVALFVGIFAIGLTLVLGQNLRGTFTSLANSSTYNVYAIASSADKAAVDAQLMQLGNTVQRQQVSPFMSAQVSSINGIAAKTIIADAPPNPKPQQNTDYYGPKDDPQSLATAEVNQLGQLQGFDLAASQVPDPNAITMTAGEADTQAGVSQAGAALGASDAGSTNVVLPYYLSQWPLSLKLGDRITMGQPTANADKTGANGGTTGGTTGAASVPKAPTATLTVKGFYKRDPAKLTIFFGSGQPVMLDAGVVNGLGVGGLVRYGYYLRLDPASADASVLQLEKAVPTAQVLSLADALIAVNTLINDLVLVLESIASLALLAGVIGIANAVALAMLERRRELGIFKAIGHTSRSVLGEVLLENGLVGLLGGLLAMLAALLTGDLLGGLLFNFGTTVDTTPVALGVTAGAIALCMVVAALVAWGATRVRPLEVLRYE